jgi:alkylation response protein AidB-like acyl-CoA dehydrogenase
MLEHQWVQFKLTRMLQNVMIARRSYLEALFSNEQFGLLYTSNHPALAKMDAILPERIFRSKAFRKLLLSGPMKNILRKLGDSLTPEAVRRASRTGATAKVLGTDLGMENCSMAIDLMGCDGIRHDRGMEKLYRDAKLLQIYEGTNQINTREIYKGFLGRPAEV